MKITIKNGLVLLCFDGDTIKSENKIVIEELDNDNSASVEIQGGNWIGRKDSIGTNILNTRGSMMN